MLHLGHLFGLFVQQSFAQAAAGAPAAQPSTVEMFFPFIILFVVMYFFLIRPQAKKQKDHQKFVTEMKRGDEVVTTGGILGKIEGLNEVFVTLEIATGVSIRILRTQVAGSSQAAKLVAAAATTNTATKTKA